MHINDYVVSSKLDYPVVPEYGSASQAFFIGGTQVEKKIQPGALTDDTCQNFKIIYNVQKFELEDMKIIL